MDAERRIPVYKLLFHKNILRQMLSFSEQVPKCNFTTRTGWKGKTYVELHDVCEYRPEMRGVDVLDVYYLRANDTVILTDEQYADYRLIAGLD